MNSRQINSVLWTAATVLAIGAVTCATLTVMWPLSGGGVQPRRDQTASASTQPSSLPPLESLQAAANVPLHRAAAVATTQTVTAGSSIPADTPPFTLAGTIGTSLALLRTPAGQIELKAVGEEAMGAKVLAIRPSQVDVRFNGQSVTLQKPKEPGSPG
jgi:hypothetical protein